jgi:zinc protease
MRIRNLFVIAMLFIATLTSAQEMPKIPVDQDVRIGKLANGLTYYIRHNNYPEHMADFYIAQRVGSINENDDQRGLAHFLEHMAFNGSEHFPGSSLLDYTRSIGVEFGRNLNAETNFDYTLYNICDVPSTRQSAVDSCLLILKDWSNGLTLDTKEIDKERGVIHSEYRMRFDASQRMLERALPKIYQGSKYGERFPIGLMSIVEGFKPDVLRAYYKKWYRPDNQGLVIVGDIDVDKVEAQIKKLFSATKVPANAAKVEAVAVPDNDKPIYVIEKDKEQAYNVIELMMKMDATPDSLKSSIAYMAEDYMKDIVSSMLSSRLNEMMQKADCPFAFGNGTFGQYLVSKTKDALTCTIVPKDGKDTEALCTMEKELIRAKKFGFTATEYERAKADYLSEIEKQYTNRNKTKNNVYCSEYNENYLKNEPIPSIETKYQLVNALAQSENVNMINEFAKYIINTSDSNMVVMEFAQDKEGKYVPTEDELKNAITKARGENVEAYVDNVKNEPLIATLPAKGKIVSEKENKQLGFKELKLSNGATVILKKTDFKDDEVKMQASAKGGQSMYGPADYTNLKLFGDIISISGLGNFSHNELQKALAGKQANAAIAMDIKHQIVNGSSTPKDLETMMQLTYLQFTGVKKDEQSYNSLMQSLDLGLKNMKMNPEYAFQDSVLTTSYNHNKRFSIIQPEDVKELNYDRILQIAKESFSNAGAFTFIFTGNFDEATLRPMIEQYIASLPSTGKTIQPKDVRTLANGDVKNHFTREMENPQASANETWRSNKVPYTLENRVKLDVASEVLSMIYLRTIREENSAAYHAEAIPDVDRDGQDIYMSITGACPMDPAKADLAVSLLYKGIKDAAVKISADDLTKVKSTMLKQADEDQKTNDYWMNILDRYNEYGVDFHTDYKKVISAITPESISAFIKNIILSSGNHVEVIMMPKKK